MPEEIRDVSSGQVISENALVAEHLRQMPSIFARALFYLCLLLIASAVAYSVFSKIDIVVVSRATAWPEGRKLRVLSDRSGIIERIYVAEGAEVDRGAPLFFVNSKETLGFRSKVEELTRLLPLKEEFYNKKIQSLTEELNHLESEHQDALAVRSLKLEQNKISVSGIDSEISYYQKEKVNLTQEFENTRILFEKRLTSLSEYNFFKGRMEKARTELEKQLSQKQIALKERDILQKEMQTSIGVYSKRRAILTHDIEGLKAERQSTLQSLQSELQRCEKMLTMRQGEPEEGRSFSQKDQIIEASYAGKVAELFFRNTGEYVRESDLLCTLLPADSPIYMDLTVLNKDIGFIEPGMRIRYKFDAFPFVDYGMLEGKVLSIAPSGVEEGPNSFVYHVRGGIGKSHFEIRGKQYPVKAGMTATAELITEKKSLFSLLVKSFRE